MLLLGTALGVFCGCTERTAEEAHAEKPKSAGEAARSSEAGSFDKYLVLTPSEIDTLNRYTSAVMVTAHASMAEGGEVECSGVLIAPHLVLTAGRCVCMWPAAGEVQEKGGSSGDGSNCTTDVTVTTVAYAPSASGEDLSYVNKEYRGTARPSSHADLAVILLGKPVKSLTPVKLASIDIEPGASVSVVGYARDEAGGGAYRKRHLIQGKVAITSETGGRSLQLDPPPLKHMARSDRGGPCLLEANEGPLLVGIVSEVSAKGPVFTSLYPQRAWLLEEIQRAAQAGTAPQQAPP